MRIITNFKLCILLIRVDNYRGRTSIFWLHDDAAVEEFIMVSRSGDGVNIF